MTAGILLLLHTLIPHQHHTELDDSSHYSQHQKADNLYEFFQLIFHQDLGEDHLEDYQTPAFYSAPSDCVDTHLPQPTYVLSFSEPFPTTNASIASYQVTQYLRFRGPPYSG